MREAKMIYDGEIGLCVTCNKLAACIHREHRDLPVWQCEEFDDSDLIVESKTNDGNARNMDEEKTLSANDKHSTLFIGLCSNCKNRKSCTYPKPEGGIWCCEEYE